MRYRIVNLDSGKTLKPFQVKDDAAALKRLSAKRRRHPKTEYALERFEQWLGRKGRVDAM